MEDLIGRWYVVRFMVVHHGGRKVAKEYSDGDCVWEFSADGMMAEYVTGHSPVRREYDFYPALGFLIISNTLYHADFLSDSELLLCDHRNSAVIELSKI